MALKVEELGRYSHRWREVTVYEAVKDTCQDCENQFTSSLIALTLARLIQVLVDRGLLNSEELQSILLSDFKVTEHHEVSDDKTS